MQAVLNNIQVGILSPPSVRLLPFAALADASTSAIYTREPRTRRLATHLNFSTSRPVVKSTSQASSSPAASLLLCTALVAARATRL
jgi:hypothetical protein